MSKVFLMSLLFGTRYRIISIGGSYFKFAIQQRRFFMWRTVRNFKYIRQARDFMRALLENDALAREI